MVAPNLRGVNLPPSVVAPICGGQPSPIRGRPDLRGSAFPHLRSPRICGGQPSPICGRPESAGVNLRTSVSTIF